MPKTQKINAHETDTLPEGFRRKIVECQTREIDEENRSITFVASTEAVARDGEILSVAGWNFEEYKRNPVVLWSHNGAELPIGKAVKIRKVGKGDGDTGKHLEITVQFAGLEQLHEKAETVYALYRDGFLNAVSVGYCVREWAELSDSQREKLGLDKYGRKSKAQDLWELSACSVPADPGALVKRGEESREALVSIRSIAPEENHEALDRLIEWCDEDEEPEEEREPEPVIEPDPDPEPEPEIRDEPIEDRLAAMEGRLLAAISEQGTALRDHVLTAVRAINRETPADPRPSDDPAPEPTVVDEEPTDDAEDRALEALEAELLYRD